MPETNSAADQFPAWSPEKNQDLPADLSVASQFPEYKSEPPPRVATPTGPFPNAPQASQLYNTYYENPMLGAEQKTVPHPDQYGPPLATAKDMFINDAGEVSFRDKSGAIIPTDMSKHVFLHGPEGPAVYARSDATAESPLVGGARVLSLGLGPTVPTTGLAPSAAEATIPRLRAAATAVYQDPEVASRVVDEARMTQAFTDLSPQLRGMDPRVIQRIQGELSDIGPTVSDLNIASERLGVIAGEYGKSGATKAAAAAQMVKKKIDEVIRTTSPEMTAADQNYAAMKATEMIVNRGDKAEVLARGGDLTKRLATQATQLLADPRSMRAFTPEEADMIREISQGSLSGERYRQAAQWLSGKLGTVLSTAAGYAGYHHSGIPAAVASFTAGATLDPLITSVLTRWGNRIGANQIDALTSAIRARSPLGQQLAQNAKDWEAAHSAMFSSPTSYTLTALAQASRELSRSLRSVGVEIGPAQLMRGGQADQDQPQVPGPSR